MNATLTAPETTARAEIVLLDRVLVDAFLENVHDFVYFKDRQSRYIALSQSLVRCFGCSSPIEVLGRTNFDFFSKENAQQSFDSEQAIIRTGQPTIDQVEEKIFPDGRTIWLCMTKMPLRDNYGEIIGTFGVSRDITASRQLERDLDVAKRNLVDASRTAGMAEVATGVLHNVGNVLSSLNVSSTMIAAGLRGSKAESLAKVCALIGENRAQIGSFLTSDAKGRKLPGFIASLASHAVSERDRLLGEIASLQKNIDHIKEIVTMQQAYATTVGCVEHLAPETLMEDALRINAGALVRHDVRVVQEFSFIPAVLGEKGKILQILVNLIRNAKYACDDGTATDKVITLQITPGAQGRVLFIVSDNGVGIPAENLTRIFAHGFTTRKHGHGFGLHSSANAAREMKGRLTACSAGLGLGATFTLDLPRPAPGFAPIMNLTPISAFDVHETTAALLDRALVTAFLENVPDLVYFKDRESCFIAVSRSKARRHGLEPADMVGKSDADFFSPEHAEWARVDEENIMSTGTPVIGKLERIVWPDGRKTWALSSKMPLRDEHGVVIGTFGLSKDVTATKQMEVDLEKAHKDLVDASRAAGMAEVATGVLHNVGNVLTSLNVSATILATGLRESKAGSLQKISALLQEHAADLGEFLTNDPKGKRVPEFLESLAQHSVAERDRLLAELGQMQQHIDHIKEIVSMQQAYATMIGVVEPLDPTVLMEDALRMNAGALVRHDVHVVREFIAAPHVTAEKAKVLQILVNLIRNAKYACDDGPQSEKLITLRIDPSTKGKVRLIVQDNGVGIPAENLTRIFGHGFTTRKTGHGFGLHSSANAATEMHGSLTVESGGPGQGATFTLELPTTNAKASA